MMMMMMKINQIFWIVIIYSACFPVSKQGSVCVSMQEALDQMIYSKATSLEENVPVQN